ncbi:hypothetical protein H0H92_006310 [Tricholoma furcatifolium]|nr:hypothetical protein H0H92_006310 [Tricholoma furcatifolium]
MAQTVFSIQEYLDNASFPAFCKSFSKVFTTARKMNALPWPQYAELQVAPGTRLLKRVIRTENIKFVNLVMQYLDNIDAPLIDVAKFAGQDCPLRLPSRGYVTYQQRDANFFRQIDNEQKFCELMEYYVLHTVSETLRWIKGYPLGSPEAAALKFQKASHLRLAHHGRWDIMALFELRTGENQLDKPSTMEDTLWAVSRITLAGHSLQELPQTLQDSLPSSDDMSRRAQQVAESMIQTFVWWIIGLLVATEESNYIHVLRFSNV